MLSACGGKEFWHAALRLKQSLVKYYISRLYTITRLNRLASVHPQSALPPSMNLVSNPAVRVVCRASYYQRLGLPSVFHIFKDSSTVNGTGQMILFILPSALHSGFTPGSEAHAGRACRVWNGEGRGI